MSEYHEVFPDGLAEKVRLFRARGEDLDEGEEPGDPEVVLCLQGGGARAAYQVGVYQALSEAGLEPDWVIGVSSGALNGAVIAGNEKKDRLAKLDELWRLWRSPFNLPAIGRQGPRMQALSREMDAFLTSFGKPHFYWPRWDGPLVNPRALSLFQQRPLRRALSRMVDFEFLKQSPVRLSIGCADIEDGTLRFFDRRGDIFIDSEAQHLSGVTARPQEIKPRPDRPPPQQEQLRVDHLMAAAAFPPGAEAVPIDNRLYWDAGVLDNSPLDAVIKIWKQPDQLAANVRRMVFVVDLWSRDAPPPRDLLSTMWRKTELEYASAISSDLQRFLLVFPTGAEAEVFHLTYESPEASPLDPMDFTDIALTERRAHGRDQTREVIADWKALELIADRKPSTVHQAVRIKGRVRKAAVCYRHYHRGQRKTTQWAVNTG
jgi:predicted acylesterase/phospholipase RssA